jgi:hypothetical protein
LTSYPAAEITEELKPDKDDREPNLGESNKRLPWITSKQQTLKADSSFSIVKQIHYTNWFELQLMLVFIIELSSIRFH